MSSAGLNERIKKRLTTTWTGQLPVNQGVGEENNSKEKFKGPLGLTLLHSSQEPLIDLIFVHGLKGDSVKTWRKGGDPSCFWPQSWLPVDPELKNANIHTYGYDADWGSRKSSILDVLDFGRGLLEEMRNAPTLRKDTKRPIIMIGHSMGGIVIKKAFNLAQEIPEFKGRIQAVFFLSTPHRGNDYTATLNNILSVSGIWSSRDYLDDITSGSLTLQKINDEFGQNTDDLKIFSFYETIKTTYGPSSKLVVSRDSAVLGDKYENERVQYMDADHRTVCKFPSVDDPNYRRVRNALATAVNTILDNASAKQTEEDGKQMKDLALYLGVQYIQEEYDSKASGTCQWLHSRDDFLKWRDNFHNPDDAFNPSIFWIHSKPGTGKTVLAESVALHLRELHGQCASHYFRSGDTQSSSVSWLLRSIAYQMARATHPIREALLQLQDGGPALDFDDTQGIWIQLFKKKIFQLQIKTPQFWVIDALDECDNYQRILSLLKGVQPNFPLRMFLTSRHLHDMDRLVKTLRPSVAITCLETPLQIITTDIERYIKGRTDSSPIGDSKESDDLLNKILQKSNGSFLWVRLVLDELETVFSRESMMEILDDIPDGMKALYERILRTMGSNFREKHISKAILRWLVTCSRKITLSELSQALRLDINASFPSTHSAVEGLCGHLVTIDRDTGLIDLVHITAREFLLSYGGEFEVSMKTANEQIARVCLQLLSSSELHRPRHSRAIPLPRPVPSPLLKYAITHFSEHIHHLSHDEGNLMPFIDRFLNTNVLSWIEQLALEGDLRPIIRTSRNLKKYVTQASDHPTAHAIQARDISTWATDLERITTAFGDCLLQEPWCIYFVIPPLCPAGSAIYQTYAKLPGSISLDGQENTDWSPCIASVHFENDFPVAVSCSDNLIAVAWEMNCVSIYETESFQKRMSIHQDAPVDLVHIFNGFLVTCTTRTIVLHDLEGNLIWEKYFRYRFISLLSLNNLVVVISQHGHLLVWDRDTGEEIIDKEFPHSDREKAGSLVKASVSPSLEIVALGYKATYNRGGEVCLWDVDAMQLLTIARHEGGWGPADVLFHPDPTVDVLLVVYDDHRLCLHDAWSGAITHTYYPLHELVPRPVSCSANERTLVIIDSEGGIAIWDFLTLRLIHYLEPSVSLHATVRYVVLTSDGLNFAALDNSYMRLWSLGSLVSRKTIGSNEAGHPINQLTYEEDFIERHFRKSAHLIFSHPTLEVVYSVHSVNGVRAFDALGDQPMMSLDIVDRDSRLVDFKVSNNNITASCDINGSCQIKSLSGTGLTIDQTLSKTNGFSTVRQLCFSAKGDFLLISCSSCDYIYKVSDGSLIAEWNCYSIIKSELRYWIAAPDSTSSEQHFILLADGALRSYEIQDEPKLVKGSEVRLDMAYNELLIHDADLHPDTHALVLEATEIKWPLANSIRVLIFDLSKTHSGESPQDHVVPSILHETVQHLRRFLGFVKMGKDLIFLDKDSWVISTTVHNLRTEKSYTRHFFLPEQHFNGAWSDWPVVKTPDDLFVFMLGGKFLTIHNGLRSGVKKFIR